MRIRPYIITAISILSLAFQPLKSQEVPQPFLEFTDHPWVDSVFRSLTPEERIGQLIWLEVPPGDDIEQYIRLNDIVRKKYAGGIIFSGGRPERVAEMVNYFEEVSEVPLLIIRKNDRKPGLEMDSVISFPSWTTLGSVNDDELIRRMGLAVAEQYLRAGVNVSLNSPGQPVKNEILFRESLLHNGIISVSGDFPLSFRTGTTIPVSAEDPESTVREISEKVRKNIISRQDIDDQCRKILSAKYWAGLSHFSPVEEHNLNDELSKPSLEALVIDLYSNALTVIRNEGSLMPVRDLKDLKTAVIAFNSKEITLFQKRVQDYIPTDIFNIVPSDEAEAGKLAEKLKDYDLVIAGIFENADSSGLTGGSADIARFLDKAGSTSKTIAVYFGNPYLPGTTDQITKSDAILVAYEDNNYTQDLSAQLIFGGIGAKGTLQSGIAGIMPAGSGIMTTGNIRLGYALPENAGLSSPVLNSRIDSVVNIGLEAGAYPGCEVMVARKGIVVFHKTYGYHTYEKHTPVWKEDLFDLASVTKVSSTLAGLMLLDSRGKFSVDNSLADYLHDFRKTNKENLLMKDLLAHQAGMRDWIPFWKETVRADSSFKRRTFSHEQSARFPVKVADDLFIHKNYRKKIMEEIKKSPLGAKKYVYSDLTFIISTGIIDHLSGEPWYEFVTDNIYHKLGAYDICFNPLPKYPLERIVPTEYDSLFRRQLLHGTVHDEGAAMLGGISGHAGLFATANDLMKLMEMYRRMGEYGGEQIIRRDVLERYTRVQFPENDNRRGLGFDKPLLNNSEVSDTEAYPAKGAPPESFGHSGYTGTFVWMDPVNEITYVFLSNRVHPTRNNNLLSELNIRSQILQAVYDSMAAPKR
ncbi:MAG: serine hydrolase [Bacteroidales bacterium]